MEAEIARRVVGKADAVEAAGGAITTPTADYPGGRRFAFRDPGGSGLLVYSPGE